MSFDALTLSAVRDELDQMALGSRVQRVAPVGPLQFVMELYAAHRRLYLFCSVAGENARAALVRHWPARATDAVTPFLLLLRKHVRDGRVQAFEQPPFERVLRLRVSKLDERGVLRETLLIIETMGRRGNAILVDEAGLVMDALKRSGPERNPKRPVLPRHPYVPPPPQERLDPFSEGSWLELERLAGGRSGSDLLEKLLGSALAGFSPLAAREAAYRATARAGALARDVGSWLGARAAVTELLGPLRTGLWEPTVAYDGEQPVAFAPYRLTHLSALKLRPAASISEAVELWAAAPAPRAIPAAARPVTLRIEAELAQLRRKHEALQRALERAAIAEDLRLDGETLLASLGSIRPGQTCVELAGRRVELSGEMTPLEQANGLFAAYRKARDAGRQVPEMLTSTRHQIDHLEELLVLAEVATSPADLRGVQEELEQGALPSQVRRPARAGRKQAARPAGRVRRLRSPDGLEILVGVTARGNAEATFKLAMPDDLWLHARGVPGAHVIIRSAGQGVPARTVEYAAGLAAGQSPARTAARVDVDVTQRRHVRRVPGGPAGLATYQQEHTIAVAPRPLVGETATRSERTRARPRDGR
ncbi:MAG: NFACT family protein [Chloroflexi bacterium]|nr:NFACT family protein [Chloroflexota bacterium]